MVIEPPILKRLLVGLAIVAALLIGLMVAQWIQDRPQETKPRIGLMTTLPLIWGEGGLTAAADPDRAQAPAMERLSEHFDIVPIDTVAALPKAKIAALVLAQSRRMAPAELVKLDEWVRRGGRVIILADPALHWESSYPIGDRRRPLFTSLLSPLFSHWGLELVLPMENAEEKSVIKLGEYIVRTSSVGAWQRLKTAQTAQTAQCSVALNLVMTECTVGQGKAVLVADADLLDGQYWQASGIRIILGSDDFGNLDWFTNQIDRLASDR